MFSQIVCRLCSQASWDHDPSLTNANHLEMRVLFQASLQSQRGAEMAYSMSCKTLQCEKQTNSIPICYRRPQGQGAHKYTCIWTCERQHRYKCRLTVPQQWQTHKEHPIRRHNPLRSTYTLRLMKGLAIKMVHNNTCLSVEQISHFNGEMSFTLGCIASYHFSEWLPHKLFIGFC